MSGKDDIPKPGTVAELRKKFEKGKAAQSPAHYAETSKEAVVRAVPGVRSNVATYNLALRGAQVKAQRRATLMAGGQRSNDTKQSQETYELLQFTEEFEEYPWHLAAQFVDDEDAFWVPDLAAALDTGDERLINETVLRLFFEEHDAGMVSAVDALLDNHEGREDELFDELQREYIQLQLLSEEEPTSVRQASSVDSPSVGSTGPVRRKSTVVKSDEGGEEKSEEPTAVRCLSHCRRKLTGTLPI